MVLQRSRRGSGQTGSRCQILTVSEQNTDLVQLIFHISKNAQEVKIKVLKMTFKTLFISSHIFKVDSFERLIVNGAFAHHAKFPVF